MNEMSALEFKIYCIEEFRQKHGLTAPETVDLFESTAFSDSWNSRRCSGSRWTIPFWT